MARWRSSPFVFCLFLAIGSNLPADLGRKLTFNAPLDYFVVAAIGRAPILILLNEAVVAGASIALGRKPQGGARLHAMLFGAAIFASFTPNIATYGSLQFAQNLPPALGVLFTAMMAAISQAGLWGETYLITQTVTDLLHGKPPIEPAVRKPWSSGAGKGAVYGFVFMLLIGAVGAFTQNAKLFEAFVSTGVFGAAIVGEFSIRSAARSWRARIRRRRSGAVSCANISAPRIICAGLRSGRRSGSAHRSIRRHGSAATASCSARCRARPPMPASISCPISRPSSPAGRRRLSSWRVYLFGTLLGGLVGGALGW
ncbi:MAG: hypothetical protein KF904_00830 [Rhodoblastus sp.]|nr:hypothetical protein [Rhodoblastus sp.]